ncbi:HPF/RaiA family ribosome-associated protein [Chitinimonas sp.]|uniref:HPF/RaiA family ribosome-associated protein n=1 Tax=Chitinimonas sp. TaxID=1934313 RepID=UPI0035B08CD9
MKTDIKARNFLLTEALSQHVERRLDFALGRLDAHIHKVTVRLSDINGPRGGIDKHCHIQVSLHHLPDVVIEDCEADLYIAINRASERASRTVMRKLGRQRQFDASDAWLAAADDSDVASADAAPGNTRQHASH